MRIGICTIFHKNHNYGGVLQAFALQFIIKQMNIGEVIHIVYCGEKSPLYPSLISRCKQYSFKQIIQKFLEKQDEKKTYIIAESLKRRHELFVDFKNQHIKQTEVYTFCNLKKISTDFDIFIVGSDQVWNPNVVNQFYTLDFPTQAKRISYAASISRHSLSDYEQQYMIPRLKKFDKISVREFSAKKILDDIRIESTVVMDPTMLLNSNIWNKIASPRIIEEPYVFVYSFSDFKLKQQIIDYYEQKGIHVYFLPYAKQKYNRFDGNNPMRKLWDIGPSEFLSLIKYAEYIYTDSFHGTCFSILFHKQFSVYEREKNAGKVSMNSRLVDLLTTFNLNNRFVADEKSCFYTHEIGIDYSNVDSILHEKQRQSIEWLYKAIMK